MIRNNEYRNWLIRRVEILRVNSQSLLNVGLKEQYRDTVQQLRNAEFELQEYDRLHPESVQVESVIVRDKRGYKDAPAHMKGCVTLFHNLSCCNITLIDNALNIEIK